ncbi:Pogo transposable element [Phytophthora megakarya]|uniref:Pogo transposable element n=1 Tax=Phytophthora megakarya TaxID=4795 RepID=A0A225VZ20_9STRA|nr:Pogo transposable element [Phytophthora megakarya]
MPRSRVAKSMAEEKEVVTWIEQNGEVPTRATTYFQNERGWKISGVQPRLAEVEDMIFDRVLFLRSEKKKVTRDLIAEVGKHLAQAELGNTQFLGSSKWVDGFMHRYDLSLRRTTNLTVLTNDVLTDRAVCYMEFVKVRKDRLNMDHTVLMDETAVYFEDPRCQTVDVTGARHVVLKSTGFASMRITAVLARIDKTYGAYQKRAWVDFQLQIKWLDLVFPPIFDASASCEKNLQMFVIPGGLTPYVQAGDIGIYKSFKDKLSVIIDEWKSSDRVMYTEAGNPKQPPVEDVVQWVQTAWKTVPDVVVRRSVAAADFSPFYEDWHISHHDVYGDLFYRKWLSRDEESESDDVG